MKKFSESIIYGGWRGKPFSNWKLNEKHNLTVLVNEGRCLFKLQGGGRQNLSPQQSFRRLFLPFQLFGPLVEREMRRIRSKI